MIEIWGKANCPSCMSAKQLCETRNLDYTTNIRLFNSTLQRIAASPKHITVSLSNSQSRLSTFFIYTSEGKDSGINALLHPDQFLELISPAFDRRNYGYQIQVLHKVIQSHQEQQLKSNHLNTRSPPMIAWFHSA